MKINYVARNAIAIVLGLLLIVVGIFVIDQNTKSISGVCIGIGAGLASMCIAKLIIYLYYEKHPAIKKQSNIDSKDERTMAITNKAKAKAFDILTAMLMIIPFLFILINLSLWMILATIGLYLFGFFVQIFYTMKYSKEM